MQLNGIRSSLLETSNSACTESGATIRLVNCRRAWACASAMSSQRNNAWKVTSDISFFYEGRQERGRNALFAGDNASARTKETVEKIREAVGNVPLGERRNVRADNSDVSLVKVPDFWRTWILEYFQWNSYIILSAFCWIFLFCLSFRKKLVYLYSNILSLHL